MKKIWLIAMSIFLFSTISSLWGGLSHSEWNQLNQEMMEHYKNKNDEALGQTLEKIGKDDSKRAVRLLVKVLPKLLEKDPCYAGAVNAFGAMQSEEAVNEMGSLLASSSTPWKIQLILIDGISKWEAGKAIPVVTRALSSSNTKVLSASIRLLGQKGDSKAVDPLIEKMIKLDKKRDSLWEDCQKSLTKILGVKFWSGAEYKSWVATRGYNREVTGSGEREDHRKASVERTLFGMAINCNRSVFILDVSGSMVAIDPETSSGGHMGTTNRNPEPSAPDPERMRIRRAKKELIRVIQGLKSSQSFNVIAYSSEVWIWSKNGCREASSGNKSSAVQFVETFKAEGTTATDLALAKAYETSHDAECFYLLSDGAPTRDGQNIIPTQEILELILKCDRFRRVKIHTLGFEGASVDFMKAVANLTGGNYKDIK